MSAAFFGVYIVGIRINKFVIPVVVLNGVLDLAVFEHLIAVNNLGEHGLLVAIEIFHEILDAAVETECVMILSALSPAELVNVISTENANLLKTVKGIGLKTAQRVIVDLKDKIKTMGATVAGGSASAGMLLQSASVEVQEEAVAALTMLGFAAAPSQKVVLAILKEEPDAPVEKVIKLALKRL